MKNPYTVSEKWDKFFKEQVKDHITYFHNHIPIDEDELIVILKGHLLIEELLREFLKLEAVKPKLIDDARLSFYQLLSIVESIYTFKRDEWTWEGARRLNTIRNRLAHKLTPERSESDIITFCKFIEKQYPPQWKGVERSQILNRTMMAIGLIYGNLSAYLEACKNSKSIE